MRELTEEQKKKFYLYKDTKEEAFPREMVWKLWVPLPGTMYGGLWLQYPSRDEALEMVLMTEEERQAYLGRIFDDGGW